MRPSESVWARLEVYRKGNIVERKSFSFLEPLGGFQRDLEIEIRGGRED